MSGTICRGTDSNAVHYPNGSLKGANAQSMNPPSQELRSLNSNRGVWLRSAVLAFASCLPLGAISQTLMHTPGAEVTADDVQAVAQRMQESSRIATLSRDGNVQRLAEEILLRRLLAAQAEKDGLAKDAVAQAQLRQARERVLSDIRLAAVEAAANPGAEALTQYAREIYRADPSKYQSAEQWRVRHILISSGQGEKAREKALQIQAELRKGAAFDTLAKQYSEDKGSAAMGGDLGWFSKGALVKEFQAAVEKLKTPGEVSDIVETQYGLHLIRLEGHRASGQRTFEEVQDAIEKEVLAKRQADAKQDLIRGTLKDAKTEPAAIQALANSYSKP